MNVHSLKFSSNSNFLTISSDSGTVHIFDLKEGNTDTESNSPEQQLGSDSEDDYENKEIYIN